MEMTTLAVLLSGIQQIEEKIKAIEEEAGDGVSIANVYIDGSGDLIIEYTTGHVENVGHVVGADGQNYVLTAQDESDIADIVLSKLPTTQEVLYGNTSN